MIEFVLLSTFIISCFSIIGIVTLSMSDELLDNIVLLLVSLSAGALLGGALFHLLPESLEELNAATSMTILLFGFILFLVIEKVLHWRHCHKGKCEIHTFAYINLIGDAVHNLIDGLIIAAAFLSNFNLGVITSLAVALHEIPQEIGDFGVLLHSGMKKKKALFLNFLTATTIILGGLVGFYLNNYISEYMVYSLPFAAGGFLYISSSDLIPEIRKEKSKKKWLLNFSVFLIGLSLMYSLTLLKL